MFDLSAAWVADATDAGIETTIDLALHMSGWHGGSGSDGSGPGPHGPSCPIRVM